MGQLARYGATFAILVVALRIIWVYPGAVIAYWIRRHLLHQTRALSQQQADLYRGLDRNARGAGAGRRHLSAHGAAEW